MTQARLLGGRYQVGELLGYGGMAEVHRGRDLRLGRDVAIKMLRTDLARDDTFQLRFRREAQNAASLNHPAIVAIYDTGEERGPTGETLPFIVMEFVNGRTLKEVLAAEGRLMPRRALEITAEMSAALDFSHRHGIIHRDIKPGNVMLTQTGQIKVMDFGIARALASGASTMTQTSAVIGTAQYLSPEQARGEAVDARSDVYASGCVLYELVCGHPPFVGDSPVSVAYQHVREDPKPPSQSNRDVSPAVDAIVLKALAKNPLNRYQSAGEMRADVLRAAAGRPVYAEPVLRDGERGAHGARGGPPGQRGAPARVSDARRRRTSGWAIMALTALGVLAVVALVAGLIVSQQPTRETVPQLAGMSDTDAISLLHRLKLSPNPQETSGADCTPNQVISGQTPDALSRVDAGTTVTYKVCVGPGKVVIPSLIIGASTAIATQQLESLHLKVTVIQVDSEKPADTVIETIPAAGQSASEGSEVKLKVSKGNFKLMPNVSGGVYTEAVARGVLQNLGFTNVDRTTQLTTNLAEDGMVINQDPAAGTPRDPKKKVLLIIGVYSGPSPSATVSPAPS